METNMNSEKIRQLAKALDDAIEKRDIEELVSYFSSDCKICLPGITLSGYGGLRKAIRWMFRYLKDITLVPVTIIAKDNIFFEEFIVKAKSEGRDFELRQAEILEYDAADKVKSIRLYFDRLEFAQNLSYNFIDRVLIKMARKASLKGLVN
jgi:ketosteroid isomerase-like protein